MASNHVQYARETTARDTQTITIGRAEQVRTICSIRESLGKYATQLEQDVQRADNTADRLSHILGLPRPTEACGPKAPCDPVQPTIATEMDRISAALDRFSAVMEALERLT